MRKARKATLMEVVLEEPRKASMTKPCEQRLGTTGEKGRFALFALEVPLRRKVGDAFGSAENGTSPAWAA